MQVEVISDEAAREIITPLLAYEAVRGAFVAVWEGRAGCFPVLAGRSFLPGAVVNIKFGYEAGSGAIGLKAGSYWPGNEARGLPNHAATTVLLDPSTGFPRAFINAETINRWRTAAADAVSVDALARCDARSLAVLGAGRQAEYEVRAIAQTRSLQRIRIASRTRERSMRLADMLSDLGVAIDVASPREAVEGADIVVCVTSSTTALIEQGWVRPGTHISAMGADRIGKQELDPALLRTASLFADDPVQSCVIGEFQHLEVSHRDSVRAIGGVLAHALPGRQSLEEVTIFDSSGLAVQDVAVAQAVLAEAQARRLCRTIEF